MRLLRRLFALLSTGIAIAAGLLMLIGLLSGEGTLFNTISDALLQIAVIMVAVAVLFGLFNLLSVHGLRLRHRERGWPYSIVLIVSALLVIGLWLAGAEAENRALVENVQISVESALAALLVFTLVFGAYRLMRQRVTWGSLLFIATVLIMLLGTLLPSAAGASGPVALLGQVRAWLLGVPVSAGIRGLLLGIALATVITAVRILVGQERAYRD